MNIEERFLKYVSFPTMSDEGSSSCPSSEKQLAFARYLEGELRSIGLEDVKLADNGYVYGRVPANSPARAVVGFIAHMDTSDAASDQNIKARVVDYKGGDILLNEKQNIVLSPKDYPNLQKHLGQHLVVTDGTTLLGADDKAGIAAIVTAAERLIKDNIPHGDVMVGFTPDEEIGRGADGFDVQGFGADFAYTLDGGSVDGVDYNNFNAASADIHIKGVSAHPGSAKGSMINAARIAAEFAMMLPQQEIPELTDGEQGFYHMTSIEGSCETALVRYILRDHDSAKLEQKKQTVLRCAGELNRRYGEGTVTAVVKDSYRNMREVIEPRMEIVELARDAIRRVGGEPHSSPVRGGTDGATLSYMGLPCPNLGTGGENAHSRFEYCSVEDMLRMSDVIIHIVSSLTGR